MVPLSSSPCLDLGRHSELRVGQVVRPFALCKHETLRPESVGAIREGVLCGCYCVASFKQQNLQSLLDQFSAARSASAAATSDMAGLDSDDLTIPRQLSQK